MFTLLGTLVAFLFFFINTEAYSIESNLVLTVLLLFSFSFRILFLQNRVSIKNTSIYVYSMFSFYCLASVLFIFYPRELSLVFILIFQLLIFFILSLNFSLFRSFWILSFNAFWISSMVGAFWLETQGNNNVNTVWVDTLINWIICMEAIVFTKFIIIKKITLRHYIILSILTVISLIFSIVSIRVGLFLFICPLFYVTTIFMGFLFSQPDNDENVLSNNSSVS